MGIYLEEKEEKNYQAFMDELEKISKKYGIAFEGCGVFAAMKTVSKTPNIARILQAETWESMN